MAIAPKMMYFGAQMAKQRLAMSQSSSASSSSSGANEFSSSLYMDAPADAVTDFVADIKNMPKYMPTTKKAEDAGDDRVRVAGGGDGFEYDTEGYLRRNKDKRPPRMGQRRENLQRFDGSRSRRRRFQRHHQTEL